MALFILPQGAKADVVLSNIAAYADPTDLPVSTYADVNYIGGTMVGTKFTTGTSDLTLNSATILFDSSALGLITANSDALQVSIYTNVSSTSYFEDLYDPNFDPNVRTTTTFLQTTVDHPGVMVGTIFFSAVDSATPNPQNPATAFTWTAPNGGLTLSATTPYWLVLSSTETNDAYMAVRSLGTVDIAAFANTSAGWTAPTGKSVAAADVAVFTATGNYDDGQNFSIDAPANSWISMSNTPLFFSLNSSASPAPEPCKTLLLLLGGAGLWWRRRRR